MTYYLHVFTCEYYQFKLLQCTPWCMFQFYWLLFQWRYDDIGIPSHNVVQQFITPGFVSSHKWQSRSKTFSSWSTFLVPIEHTFFGSTSVQQQFHTERYAKLTQDWRSWNVYLDKLLHKLDHLIIDNRCPASSLFIVHVRFARINQLKRSSNHSLTHNIIAIHFTDLPMVFA